ncbi:Glutamate-ammonia-ligase adenylyltransferase [gamma proteobacterium HdN1]|nr:Glutamate-ammonia-ligase adenylyltransferase [gamma proteobacterium HdN1]
MASPLIQNPLVESVRLHHRTNIERAIREQGLAERLDSWIHAKPERHQQLNELLIASDYAAERIQRHPQQFLELAESDRLERSLDAGELVAQLQSALLGATDDRELMRNMRLFRHEQMLRILWRDINHLASLQEVMQDLSELADASINEALAFLYPQLTATVGTPLDENGQPMPMVVFAMGKHGARELNLSSDIDLMFAFSHDGETQRKPRSITHQEFFIRLGQKLIRVLSEITADGFVFRVDMRLRPYGDVGALAMPFRAMEIYYEKQGREWERYAMIKARSVTRDNGDGVRLLAWLRPFVYRRYVDFGVIESLREMKGMIQREVLRRGNDENIKTGHGGIREIEFIVQALQLIRGGREPQLRITQTLLVMSHIRMLGILPDAMVDSLHDAYVFLRETEHRIQAQKDQQTQRLPDNPSAGARLAWSMGFEEWESFYQRLQEVREQVSEHFTQFISGGEDEAASAIPEAAVRLWEQSLTSEESEPLFALLGYRGCHDTWEKISQFHDSRNVAQLRVTARQRLDRLMPMLIASCARQRQPCSALVRCLPLVENILRRSAYMALLVENPRGLERLTQLFSASVWVAETMSNHPFLLDGLLDAAGLFAPPRVEQLKDELRQQMLRIPEDDLETQMETLRQFKLAHMLRVAASDITGSLPIMKVSDYLTWLAETLLQAVFELAWHQLTDKHGVPFRSEGQLCAPDFIVIGYGKVGGIELSYSSDLDLVFMHDADPNLSTDGERSIDNGTFFARLGQRLIHLLSTRTVTGPLYDIDMRLRPSGNSGMLVTSLTAFNKYQEESAWTWEHQALVRARVVAGCPRLKEKFEALRREILSVPRDPAKLSHDVIEMRKKMNEHLSKAHDIELHESMLTNEQPFHLKQDPGGMVDIEFIAQFLVLRHSAAHPEMSKWSDNMRILETAEDLGILDPGSAQQLREAWLAYREQAHRDALQNEKGCVPGGQYIEYRRTVRAQWHAIVAKDL